MNKVYVIGMGPGAYEQMTVKAVRTLEKCDVIVGYTVYIELLKEYFGVYGPVCHGNSSSFSCNAVAFICGADSDGLVYCSNSSANERCTVSSSGSVNCR